jgi:hypothetical protein
VRIDTHARLFAHGVRFAPISPKITVVLALQGRKRKLSDKGSETETKEKKAKTEEKSRLKRKPADSAFVVGIDEYPSTIGSLSHAVKDAKDTSDILTRLGWTVKMLTVCGSSKKLSDELTSMLLKKSTKVPLCFILPGMPAPRMA